MNMTLKYLITTGLLIQGSSAFAWVLDDSLSSEGIQKKVALEAIQGDLFEHPPQSVAETDFLSGVKLSDMGVTTAPTIPQIPAITEPRIKLPILEKKVTSLTPKDIADKKYNVALQKIELGLHSESEKMFIDILKSYPTHILSRVQLSKLSILRNDYAQAEKWLTEDENHFSSDPIYLQTLAIIYERTGRKKEALSILEKMPREHEKSIEFYSLLASLYQQTGNYNLAQRYYSGLLNREPNNPTWLLGLSISLDSGGEKKMAISHYKKILEKGGLDKNILSFVQNRVTQLSKM